MSRKKVFSLIIIIFVINLVKMITVVILTLVMIIIVIGKKINNEVTTNIREMK